MLNKKNILFLIVLMIACNASAKPLPLLKISSNGRYFTTVEGKPFFWLGDTGWLLLSKLNREAMTSYFRQRKEQGFNVVQVMLLHSLVATNVYGDSALHNRNIAMPDTIAGSNFVQYANYDYWDNVDYALSEAEANGLYLAMVPVWGTNVKGGGVTIEQAKVYAKFLAQRYKNYSNVIWMNGGDIAGANHMEVWNAIGETLQEYDKNHLITFHPVGRRQSGEWFNNQSWLNFNMVQSGHKDYRQDTAATDLKYGEDNWRYINDAYTLQPLKPVLDAEPSYEAIPHGLHDTTQPPWQAADVRRYAYWSVFAGGCGFTYGNNAVMQFLRIGDKTVAYGAKQTWHQAINAEGAEQMKYLSKLLLSVPFETGKPAQNMVLNSGDKYERLAAFKGSAFTFIYTYNGKDIEVNMALLDGKKSKAYWYNPRNGDKQYVNSYDNKGTHTFNTPGEVKDGNDWVLILEKAS
ncbi:DUF4038 domain-containing protein [Ilyomonas limi]|uniref:DUF4038 domain-containing protein n=1 Tax=Ilyomonas limi TaxID=2575867 RepID=A0A4U3KWU6_9BACT|nr:glycoside hydrolase family 140 protein [Ilyomonas limi]TKK67028.1 DUF4038 domain-containing protein [Ilyomonas limi]